MIEHRQLVATPEDLDGAVRRIDRSGDHPLSDPTPDEATGGAHDPADLPRPPPTRTEAGPRGMGHVPEHTGDDWWGTWLRRTGVALLATLALAGALIWAWVGGLHAPSPRDVPVAVITGDAAALGTLADGGGSVRPMRYATGRDADEALADRRVSAILASDATGPTGGLNLTLAGGAGPGVAEAVATSLTVAAGDLGLPLAIEDTHPVAPADPGGRTPFYLMMAWIIGGLLAAVILGVAIGTVPRDLDRLGMRLGALAAFSLALGLLGALLAGPWLGIWGQHTFGLWMAGALITFTAALIASALQSWLGMWGTGLGALLMIVLGVPGSGGLVAAELMPGFFRGMHRWLPTGLGTDLVRGLEYFGRAANTWPITGLALWSLASVVALVASTAVLGRHAREHAISAAEITGQAAQ